MSFIFLQLISVNIYNVLNSSKLILTRIVSLGYEQMVKHFVCAANKTKTKCSFVRSSFL